MLIYFVSITLIALNTYLVFYFIAKEVKSDKGDTASILKSKNGRIAKLITLANTGIMVGLLDKLLEFLKPNLPSNDLHTILGKWILIPLVAILFSLGTYIIAVHLSKKSGNL